MINSKLSESKKREIIEKTKELIETKGIEKTSIRDIVKSIGMAQGLFYYYFKSKEEVIQTIINEYVVSICTDIAINIKKIVNDFSTWDEKLEKISELIINIYINNKSQYEIFDKNENGQLYQSILYIVIDKMALQIEDAIQIAIKNKYIDIKYPQETAYMIIYGILNLIYYKNVEDEKVITQLIKQTLNVC
ncbi:MAG: TetR/AcrR family transcriptional regulator [Clostridia bacterium]